MNFFKKIKSFIKWWRIFKTIKPTSYGLYVVMKNFLLDMSDHTQDDCTRETLIRCARNLAQVIREYEYPDKSTIKKLSSTTECIRKESLNWK